MTGPRASAAAPPTPLERAEQNPVVRLAKLGTVASVAGAFTAATVKWLSQVVQKDERAALVVVLSLIASLVAITALVGRTRRLALRTSNLERTLLAEHREADRALLDRLLAEMNSSNEHVRFLHDHNFADPFPAEAIKELERFSRAWTAAEREFHDPIVEEARKDLVGRVDDFVVMVGFHAVAENGLLCLVGSTGVPATVRETRCLLAARLANAAWQAHQQLVRTARGRLGV